MTQGIFDCGPTPHLARLVVRPDPTVAPHRHMGNHLVGLQVRRDPVTPPLDGSQRMVRRNLLLDVAPQEHRPLFARVSAHRMPPEGPARNGSALAPMRQSKKATFLAAC